MCEGVDGGLPLSASAAALRGACWSRARVLAVMSATCSCPPFFFVRDIPPVGFSPSHRVVPGHALRTKTAGCLW